MELLQARSEILQSLETNNKTLDAELTAKRHQHDSAYTQNIIWFAAAVTLTVVAFHKFIGGQVSREQEYNKAPLLYL